MEERQKNNEKSRRALLGEILQPLKEDSVTSNKDETASCAQQCKNNEKVNILNKHVHERLPRRPTNT